MKPFVKFQVNHRSYSKVVAGKMVKKKLLESIAMLVSLLKT